MGDECIFCRIIAKEIPAYTLIETDAALAFLDVTPQAPGHTLVIPKRHAETLLDLSVEEVRAVFEAVQDADRLLMERLAPDGITIGINQGPAAKQAVPHVHVHLMPRFTGDGGGSVHTVVTNPPTQSLEELYKRLTAHIQ